MGYFSSLADSAFKENPSGNGWLYYPNGILSKGRLVSDIETKDKLHCFQKRLYMFGIPLGVLYGFAIDKSDIDAYTFILPVISIALVLLRQYALVKDLPVSSVKLGYKESVSTGLKGLPSWYIYLLYTLSLLTIGFGIYFYLLKSESPVGIIFIGTGVVSSLLALITQKLKKI